jgi:transcriptional regulator with XRE-family HTH domain
MKPRTLYEEFEASPEKRKMLRQEELILQVTESFVEALNETNTTRSELARKLNKTKSFVTQLFRGGRNLTLRTMSDVADAMGYRIRVTLEPETCHTLLPVGWKFREPVVTSDSGEELGKEIAA